MDCCHELIVWVQSIADQNEFHLAAFRTTIPKTLCVEDKRPRNGNTEAKAGENNGYFVKVAWRPGSPSAISKHQENIA